MTGVSFCITTSGTNDSELKTVIDSIVALNIPNYEVIFIGGDSTTIETNDKIKHIPFDENQKAHVMVGGMPGRWTTRKKNLAVQASQYEVCVVQHDHTTFDPDWWIEFEKFGTYWDICIHQHLQINGARGSGWRVDRHPLLPRGCMIPYDLNDFVDYMPIQGNYVCIKREKYLEEPMDENRLWGQAEDTEWSTRIVPKFHIRCNPKCIIRNTKAYPWDHRHLVVDMPEMESMNSLFDALRSCLVKNIKLEI